MHYGPEKVGCQAHPLRHDALGSTCYSLIWDVEEVDDAMMLVSCRKNDLSYGDL
jgi:hypothetical protein